MFGAPAGAANPPPSGATGSNPLFGASKESSSKIVPPPSLNIPKDGNKPDSLAVGATAEKLKPAEGAGGEGAVQKVDEA